ncbi:unnamed protein product [Ambrosiozyma monospora]|uniref:Unnamed protein product n=1 Tax=Ambrosiozyma monospora TaxID=43982 RepID=A0ACB5T9I2_AMBMO|nr:unnamed protein product [Ambrosiozyma monospora]
MWSWIYNQKPKYQTKTNTPKRTNVNGVNQVPASDDDVPKEPPPDYNKSNSKENLRFEIQSMPDVKKSIFQSTCDLTNDEFNDLYPGIYTDRLLYFKSLALLILANPSPFSSHDKPADPFLKSTWMTLEGQIKLACYAATEKGKADKFARNSTVEPTPSSPKLHELQIQLFKTLLLFYFTQGASLDGTLGLLLNFCEMDEPSFAQAHPDQHNAVLLGASNKQDYFETLADSLLFKQVQGDPIVWKVPGVVRHYCGLTDEEFSLWFPDLISVRRKLFWLIGAVYLKACQVYNFECSSYPGLPN